MCVSSPIYWLVMGGGTLLGFLSLTFAATSDDMWLPQDQRGLLEHFNADTPRGRRAFTALMGVGMLVPTVPINLLVFSQCGLL